MRGRNARNRIVLLSIAAGLLAWTACQETPLESPTGTPAFAKGGVQGPPGGGGGGGGGGSTVGIDVGLDENVVRTDAGDTAAELLADPQGLDGSVGGSVAGGDFAASGKGTYSITVTGLEPGDPDLDSCGAGSDRDAIVATGILGVPITGAITFDLDQAGGTLKLEIPKGAAAGVDGTWRVLAYRTVSVPLVVRESGGIVEASVENAKLVLVKNPKGKAQGELVVGCRGDLNATIATGS